MVSCIQQASAFSQCYSRDLKCSRMPMVALQESIVTFKKQGMVSSLEIIVSALLGG